MSTRGSNATHPKRDDKNSPGCGGMSTELGRHGQDQAIKRAKFLTTRPNASHSHVINTTPKRCMRKANADAELVESSELWEVNCPKCHGEGQPQPTRHQGNKAHKATARGGQKPQPTPPAPKRQREHYTRSMHAAKCILH